MRYRRLAAILIMLAFMAMIFPRVLHQAGAFLLVTEEAAAVDAVVTNRFVGKALTCYKQGRCKKVVVATQKNSRPNWSALRALDSEDAIRKRARRAGIRDEDLYLLRVTADNDLRKAQAFKAFFAKKKIRAALFLFSFYKTRRHRFFFDRVFDGSEITVYVQPYKNDSRAAFEHWWRKTTYANYFMGEYLTMAWYAFNKLLWTSAV
ncbi:MAG: hypothetical protein ACE5G9_06215 [Nitrospinales bacterium]